MTEHAYSSFAQWHHKGRHASYLRTLKSSGGILDLLEVQRPAGDMSRPALSDIVLVEDMLGCSRVRGDLGGGAVLDQLNADSIAQTMILFKSQTEVGNRVNCAVHFLRYMQLGLPTGERKDNGFVFLIVVEPNRIDVHYGVGLGLPALTASELTDINRAVEDAYQINHSIDKALLTLVEKFDAVARSNYPPLVSPTPTNEAGKIPLLPSAPLGIWNICGLLCMGIFFLLFLMWGLRQIGRGGINFNPSGSSSRRVGGNPFGGGSSRPPTRGGSGSGRSGRGN
jgi:hypothetical protein